MREAPAFGAPRISSLTTILLHCTKVCCGLNVERFVMGDRVSVMSDVDPAFLYFGFCMPVFVSQLAREHASA
jgi:hypothetical protein